MFLAPHGCGTGVPGNLTAAQCDSYWELPVKQLAAALSYQVGYVKVKQFTAAILARLVSYVITALHGAQSLNAAA